MTTQRIICEPKYHSNVSLTENITSYAIDKDRLWFWEEEIIIGDKRDGGRSWKSDSVAKFRAAEVFFFQSLIELLNIRMYEEEKVEKKWHSIGFGRTWHSKIRTWNLVMSVPDWDRKIWRDCVFVWEKRIIALGIRAPQNNVARTTEKLSDPLFNKHISFPWLL